jgi:hypothetical protein
MNWCVVDTGEYLGRYERPGAAYHELLGRHFPGMTAVQITSLVEDAARPEIEVTVVVRDQSV